jgi:hypothetical protein
MYDKNKTMIFPVSALEQRPHRRQQEGLRLSVEGLLQGGEALQGPVHVGRPHEKTHRRKTSQMHCKYSETQL